MRSLDDFLLDTLFQPLADWFQRLAGSNNFFLARSIIVLIWLTFGLRLYFFHSTKFDTLFPPLWALAWTFTLSRDISLAEKSCSLKSESIACNSMRVTHVWHRYFLIIITCMLTLFDALSLFSLMPARDKPTLASAFTDILLAQYVICHYFMACTPRPPGKSLLRQWMESASNKIRELNEAPLPAPSPT